MKLLKTNSCSLLEMWTRTPLRGRRPDSVLNRFGSLSLSFRKRNAVNFSSTSLVVFVVLLLCCAIQAAGLRPRRGKDTPYTIPVVVIKYFPVKGDSIDIAVTGDWGKSLAFTRAKTDSITRGLVDSLRDASRFRQYKNPNEEPSVEYEVIKTYEFLEPLPTYKKPGDEVPMTDYKAIMERINVREWVEENGLRPRRGVREFWLWGYHGGKVGLWESNMAGPFGDISNSDRDTTDLPVLKYTYTLYHYNYQRGLSEAMEDHMHQIEALLNFVDGRDSLPEREWDKLLFWGKFVGWFPGGNWAQAVQNISKERRCGWAHFAPNSEKDYDWANKRYVLTDIEDWKPDSSGEKQKINCEKWGCNSLKWFMYWMRSLPGNDNGLTYEGKPLTNWWMFVGDFDGAMTRKAKLTN